MKNVCAVLLACLISNCYGDLIDSILSKVKVAKELMNDPAEKRNHSQKKHQNKKQLKKKHTTKSSSNSKIKAEMFQIKKKKNVTNPLKYSRKVPMLKRDVIFPKERIKTIDISPDGQRIAYLCEENKNRYIKVIPSVNQNLMSQVVKEDYPIANFSFIGKNLLYTYYDDENNLKVKVQVSFSGRKLLELPENLRSVRLFKGNKSCLAECYDGERYSLYKININSFSCSEIKELSEPIRSLFDKNLNPLLIIKNENGIDTAYIEPKKNKKKSDDDEDEVDMGFDNLVQVDQIEDPSLSKYFSVDGEKNCYKSSIIKPENCLLIEKINPFNGTREEKYRLKGISNLSQCRINVEPDGSPYFVTINNRRYEHYSWNPKFKKHISVINNSFNSWYRIGTSSDGMIWLICVVNDKSPDKFYLYDTRTYKLKIIPNLNNSPKNPYLRATECHFLPLIGKEYLQTFLTRGVNSTPNSPLILMLNSAEQYTWNYTPIVQVLANRGYNVLCLNYRKDDLPSESIEDFENSVTKATSDIATAINWATKNQIVKLGNIVLLAKKHSMIPAMQIFLKNQKIFAGYISVSPSENDLNLITGFDLEKISKPTILIGRLNNSEAVSTFTEKVSDQITSVISSNDLINQKLLTGIIESFLAKKFDNPNKEAIPQKDVNSLDVIQDGLSLIKLADDSHVFDGEDDTDNLADQYRSL